MTVVEEGWGVIENDNVGVSLAREPTTEEVDNEALPTEAATESNLEDAISNKKTIWWTTGKNLQGWV